MHTAIAHDAATGEHESNDRLIIDMSISNSDAVEITIYAQIESSKSFARILRETRPTLSEAMQLAEHVVQRLTI